MAVTLVGEIVNSCDATTGFNTGGISGDDDFVEGTGALGAKVSSTTTDFYTTSLGATAPYDFSSGGGESGYHIIMWFNTKTPINSTTGLTIIVGNGTDRAKWNVLGSGFYKGGFITRVINTAADFDTISAGTWTTTGNPAQLSNITQMGGGFTTTTSIMGSFNNCQIDQITIGEGLRVDAGTVGTPNTFETVRAADEDTAFYGWWSSSNGTIIGKGKLYIGPATGSATSVFNDTAFKVAFANELVATGFYEISTRGAGTDVTWELGNISSADSSSVRWSLTVDSTTNSFDDTNSVLSGFDTLTLSANTTMTGTTFIDGTSIVQNDAILDGCTFLDANTADGVALITSDNPGDIKNCSFTFSDGHAIEIDTPGTYTLTNNTYSGYGANDTNDAVIYNNSGGAVTLNVSGGDTPTVRNGTSATTTVNSTVSFSLSNVVSGSRVYVEAIAGGTLSAGTVMISATTISTDPWNGPSVEANQPFKCVLANASTPGSEYKRISFEDNTGSGFSRRIEQTLDK